MLINLVAAMFIHQLKSQFSTLFSCSLINIYVHVHIHVIPIEMIDDLINARIFTSWNSYDSNSLQA